MAVLVIFIMLIGGRIVPNFTQNWLVKRRNQNLPTLFNQFDVLAIGISVLALLLWTVFPTQLIAGVALLAAAALQSVRVVRWSGLQTIAEPMVFILHIGYFFIPLGFFMVGVSTIWPQTMPSGVVIHAWSTGAVGVMTLAVMTRATRGHTGHTLEAPFLTQLIYLLIVLAALTRIAAVIFAEFTITLLEVAALAWVGAYTVFLVCYAPMLIRPCKPH